jgi:hypothetical protein
MFENFYQKICVWFYDASYYFFYVWFFLTDYVSYAHGKLFPTNIDKEKIEISHVYYRSVDDYDSKKLLIIEKEGDHNMLNQKIVDFWEKNQENVKIGDLLEIHYTVPFQDKEGKMFRKSYIIAYRFPNEIKFPPYTIKRIREYYHSYSYKPGILSADLGDQDITNETERWVGPLDNFYSDLGKFAHVRKFYIVGSNPDSLVIANKDGKEFVFQDGNAVLQIED